MTSNISDHVVFFDTTLRDGEQSPGCSMTTQEKLTMAHALEDLGVDIIEAGFAMASEGDFAAIATITQAIRKPRIASLARAKKEDIEMAARALQFADRARIHIFLASSDLHLEYKLKISRQEALDLTAESIRLARTHVDDIEFSPEDATRSDRDFLVEMVRVAVEAGATTINMPDTVGYSTPEEYGRMFAEVRERIPAIDKQGIILSSHCHDDLGLAVANSLAAIQNGARQVECTINGIGERAGNAALEEIAAALYVRGDRYGVSTGIKLETSTPPARCLARSSPSAHRPTRPSSATTHSRTSPAFINTACWPTRSATKS
jgi:2-isopropylmalate synthase